MDVSLVVTLAFGPGETATASDGIGGLFDRLFAIENVAGGSFRDSLTGDDGADRFLDRRAIELYLDTIRDFDPDQSDRIDLARIDPLGATARDEAFRFIGSRPLAGPGDLRFEQRAGATFVEMAIEDPNGIGTALVLRLDGVIALAAADLVL